MYEDIEEELNNDRTEEKIRKAAKDGLTYKKFKKSLGSLTDDLEENEIYFLFEQEVNQKY